MTLARLPCDRLVLERERNLPRRVERREVGIGDAVVITGLSLSLIGDGLAESVFEPKAQSGDLSNAQTQGHIG